MTASCRQPFQYMAVTFKLNTSSANAKRQDIVANQLLGENSSDWKLLVFQGQYFDRCLAPANGAFTDCLELKTLCQLRGFI